MKISVKIITNAPKKVPTHIQNDCLCLFASGYSSTTATVIIIPATRERQFSRVSMLPVPLSSRSDCTPKWRMSPRVTRAPSGSARPLTLARTKLIQGESGLAARQGTATAIPSGMLCSAMPRVTVIPSLSSSRADATTAEDRD